MRQIKHYKISELSKISSTPVPTIRFYIKEGLLPEPIKTSKTMAYYTTTHLTLLNEIKKIKKQTNLSIKEIKTLLPQFEEQKDENTETEIVYSNIRENIIKASIGLFRKKGYDKTSITDIIHHAGVGRGTFYSNFDHKDDLFMECADQIFMNLDEEIITIQKEPDIPRKLKLRTNYFFKNSRVFTEMINQIRWASVGNNTKFKKKLHNIMFNLSEPLKDDLEMGMKIKIFRSFNPKIAAYIFLGALEYGSYFFNHITKDYSKYFATHSQSIDNIIRLLTDILLNGLSNNRNKIPPALKGPIPLIKSANKKISTRRTDIPEDRKISKIIEAAVRLFRIKGYSDTSILDIAGEAKIGKGTFYEFFKNKDELFIDCADMIFYEMYSNILSEIKQEKDIQKRFRKRFIGFIESYPKWSDMMNIIRGVSTSHKPKFVNKLRQALMQMADPLAGDFEKIKRQD
jgi:AcrR family transcriptional regulator